MLSAAIEARLITWGYDITPDDPRLIHDIYVPDPASAKLTPTPVPGDKVVVKLGEWKQRSQKLEGVIIERLGKTFEPRAELAGIYRKFNLDTQEAERLKCEPSDQSAEVEEAILLASCPAPENSSGTWRKRERLWAWPPALPTAGWTAG